MHVLKDMSMSSLSLALERIFEGYFPQFSNARKQTVSSSGDQWKPKLEKGANTFTDHLTKMTPWMTLNG